jgi:uncharacterized protein (UPF0335 family)
MTRIFFVLSFIFVTFSCQRQEADPVLMKIGRFEITKKDADQRLQVVQIFYPSNKNNEAGLIQLQNAYVIAQVMENNGEVINEHKLINETDRIDASTKNPKMLNDIKAIFKNKSGDFDVKAYRKVFILPAFVERQISGLFQSLPIHQRTHAEAMDLYHEALKNPSEFLKLGKAKKKKIGYWTVSRKNGLAFESEKRSKKKIEKGNSLIDMSEKGNKEVYEQVQQQFSGMQDEIVERWLSEIVAPTELGKMVDKIIDHSESWLVLRLIEKTNNEGHFEAVVFEKANFSDWLEAEKKKVSVATPKS